MSRLSLSLALTAVLAACGISAAPSAWAVPKVFKYDQFSPTIAEAANQITGMSLYVQPGFAATEAYGQIYYPAEGDYPMKILGLDLVLAAPPNGEGLTTEARIEIYNDEGTGAAPLGAPIYEITTADIFNPVTGGLGMPLQGNTALSINFDPEDAENSPPTIFSGRVIIVVRFTQPAQDFLLEWGTAQCVAVPELGVCGCQPVGVVVDQAPTKNANVVHTITPLGNCFGQASAWAYSETIGINGDAILRMRADVASGCAPNCDGKDCGDDGCGGTCGACGGDLECNGAGQCAPPPCVPTCGGAECGDNGCGGSCGMCAAGFKCETGQCVSNCTPACGGIECGPDGCGSTCGTCAAGSSCDEGFCVLDCVPDCDGKDCGDDGCGDVCGLCGGKTECTDQGTCELPCVASCTGRECGDDGCGGDCGTCGTDDVCEAGACVPVVTGPGDGGETPLEVTSISPAFGYQGAATEIAITGVGFATGMTARLGGTELQGVQTVGSTLITGTVPATLAVGSYLLVVIRADEQTATVADAFEVRAALTSCGDGACSADETCSNCPADCGSCETGDGSGTGASDSGGCRAGTGHAGWPAFWTIAFVAWIRRRRNSRTTATP